MSILVRLKKSIQSSCKLLQQYIADYIVINPPSKQLILKAKAVSLLRQQAEQQKPSLSQNKLALQTFSFEVVKVNEKGQISKREQKQAQYFTEDLGNGVTLEMVAIPAGEFMMGSPADEFGRFDREDPQHRVILSAFYMGRFQVTQAQWQAVMGNNPSCFKGEKRPVERVSWNGAQEFCKRLSQKTGRKYRLPSEAEWEYACRAGTTTPFYFGPMITTDLANYNGNYTYRSGPKGQYRGQTTEVGSFPPNAFGLYDMHGNLWEWCEDVGHNSYNGAPTDGSAWVSGGDCDPLGFIPPTSASKWAHGSAWVSGGDSDPRLLRGGPWSRNPRPCRSATRYWLNADLGESDMGFRVVCSPLVDYGRNKSTI